jgi:uncharacterized OB-fold protein
MTTTPETIRTARSAPVEDADSAEFWAAARRGELLLQQCTVCEHWQFPPRVLCTCCGAPVRWRAAAGTGTLYSFTVVHRAPADFADLAPYAVGLADLAEGVRMVAIVDAPLDEVVIGLPLRVAFDRRDDEVTVPVFRPDR